MFDVIRNTLRRGAAATAADLRQALEAIDEAALAAAVDVAEAERRDALLTKPDRDVRLAEEKVAAARLTLDRARASREELAIRIRAAEAAEAAAILDAEKSAVEREAAAIAEILVSQYAQHANAIVALLNRVQASNAAVLAVNMRLIAADRADERVIDAERRVFGEPQIVPLEAVSLIEHTSLRPTAASPGYGLAAAAFVSLGMAP